MGRNFITRAVFVCLISCSILTRGIENYQLHKGVPAYGVFFEPPGQSMSLITPIAGVSVILCSRLVHGGLRLRGDVSNAEDVFFG